MSSKYESKVLKNTAILYVRVICLAVLSLYTIRVVLQTLGVEDFGIYSAVAGVTAMSVFLPATLASSTQRFFSYALGEQDKEKAREVFCVSVFLYIAIAIVAVVLLETIGLYFVTEGLKIPEGKAESSFYLYHFSVATFMLSIFTSPFIALIIAHEKMQFYALVSIIDAAAKLLLVFSLDYLPFSNLVGYGAALFCASLLTGFLYLLVCTKKFDECQFRVWCWNASLAKEMLTFTGWTFFGQLSTVARNQSVTVLLNQYFSPSIVAARSVAVTTGTQINVFATGFNTSLYSPIVRAYAANNLRQMYNLVFAGSRLTFYLMWIFALPIYMHMELVLEIWLGTVPDGAVLFTRYVLIEAVILAASLPLATAARAHGRMSLYEGVMGSLQISILFISWWLLQLGAGASVVFVVAIVVSGVMYFTRIAMVSILTGLPVKEYVKEVFIGILVASTVTASGAFVISKSITGSMVADVTSLILTLSISVLYAYWFGIGREWKGKINNAVVRSIKGFRYKI